MNIPNSYMDAALHAADVRGYNNVQGMTPAEEDAAARLRQRRIDYVVYALRTTKYPLSDFIDDEYEFADQVHLILCDADDDKLGRIHDLHGDLLEKFAEYVVDNWDNFTTFAYKKKLRI